MKTTSTSTYKLLVLIVVGLCAFLFWTFLQPGALNFHEQYQMFLFESSYLTERLARPGGLADYLGEFLVQFYYVPALGGLILSLLTLLNIWLFCRLARRCGLPEYWTPVAVLPALLLWFHQTDSNVLLSFQLALTVLLPMMAWGGRLISRDHSGRQDIGLMLYLLVGVPVFYWICGAVVLPLTVFLLAYSLLVHRHQLLSILSVVYAVIIILLTAQFLPYPLYRLFGGLHYYRYPGLIPYMQILVMACYALWIPLLMLLQRSKAFSTAGHSSKGIFHFTPRRSAILQICILAALTAVGLWYKTSGRQQEHLDYDRLVRQEKWDDIIAKAQAHQPSTPMEVSCLNLALQMKGRMADDMFHFYQHGIEGLVPPFQRDFTTPLPTGEILFRIGLVNDAERYAFEAQEAIPDFSKSGRIYQRLAECEIINGNYAVAARFLRKLQHTLFYRGWADEAMTYLNNESKIRNHPVWGRLRQLRLTKDYLFSEDEMDQLFGLLFAHNYGNRKAYEYLIAWQLLKGDLQAFTRYYPLGRFANYTHIPRSYQEALVFLWTQTHPNFQGMPYSIDSEVCREVGDFARIYVSNSNSPELTQGILGQTYWSYLLCKNKQ